MQDFGSAEWHFLCAYNEWFFRPVPFAYLPEKPENRRIKLIMERKNAWNSYSADELSRVMALAEDYRNLNVFQKASVLQSRLATAIWTM